MRPKSAMILAAGRGTRMGELTRNTPKPLLHLYGKPIIDYAIDRLVGFGIERIVVNLHHHGDQIRAHCEARGDAEFLFSDESDQLLDTGGGIAKALPLLGDAPFFVVNGDVVSFDAGASALERMAALFDPKAMDAVLLLHPTVTAIGYAGIGDFNMDQVGRVTRRTETRIAPFVYTGVQLLAPALFEGAPDGPFSLNLLYDRAIEAERLYSVRHEGDWMELNTPDGIRAAEAMMAE